MLITITLILTVIWLAWSNGGNDNFMGVATLYGSGTMSYRTALTWATITTAAGCLVSVIIAGALVVSFSGRGIVPESLEGTAPLLIAVAGAAAATKFLATLLGMPTSTTHALTGGLIGVGLLAGSGASALGVLGAAFLIPLALRPHPRHRHRQRNLPAPPPLAHHPRHQQRILLLPQRIKSTTRVR